jgi:hypothetical protein
VAFCWNRAPGLYCDPSDALNIVTCPSGDLIPCADGRFCASVGRVPDCYACEAPFDVAMFCARRGPGTHCAPWWTGSSGVWRCGDGREIRCPWGAACQRLCRSQAICMADPVEAVADGGNRFCPPLTLTASTPCVTASRSSSTTTTSSSTAASLTWISRSTATTVLSVSDFGTSTVTATSGVGDPVISAFAYFTYLSSSTTTLVETTTFTSQSSETITSRMTPTVACFSSAVLTLACGGSATICLQEVPQLSCATSITNNAGQSFCLSYTSASIPGTTTITYTSTSTLITTTISSTTSTDTTASTSGSAGPCSSSFSLYGCITDVICPNATCTTVTACHSYSLSLSQCAPTTTSSRNCSSSFSLYGCIVDTICPNGTCTPVTACESYSLSLSVCIAPPNCTVATATSACAPLSTSLSPGGDTTVSLCTLTTTSFYDCCFARNSYSVTSTFLTTIGENVFTSSLSAGPFLTNTCNYCLLPTTGLTCSSISSSLLTVSFCSPTLISVSQSCSLPL